jgi:hypothetical protein
MLLPRKPKSESQNKILNLTKKSPGLPPPSAFHPPRDESKDNNLEGNRFGRKLLEARILHCGIFGAERNANGSNSECENSHKHND